MILCCIQNAYIAHGMRIRSSGGIEGKKMEREREGGRGGIERECR